MPSGTRKETSLTAVTVPYCFTRLQTSRMGPVMIFLSIPVANLRRDASRLGARSKVRSFSARLTERGLRLL